MDDKVVTHGVPSQRPLDPNELARSCHDGITAVLKTARKKWKNDADELRIMLGLKDSASRLDEWIPYLTRAKIDFRPDHTSNDGYHDDMVTTIAWTLLILATQLEYLLMMVPETQGTLKSLIRKRPVELSRGPG